MDEKALLDWKKAHKMSIPSLSKTWEHGYQMTNLVRFVELLVKLAIAYS